LEHAVKSAYNAAKHTIHAFALLSKHKQEDNMKKIIIKTCVECPHKEHKGGFGAVSYIPVCRKDNKNLPYTVHVSYGIITASATGVIPEWCPLENND